MGFLANKAWASRNRVRLACCLLTTSGIALTAMPICAEKTLIYKSVAGDGSVEFTDQAAPNSVIVTPSPLNVVVSPTSQADQTIPDPATTAPEQASEDPGSGEQQDINLTTITSVSINSPAHQETLIDHQKPIWISIQTAPATIIPAGLTAEVMLDGKRIVTGSSDRLPIDVPERGTYQLQVKIVDREGRMVAESTKHDIHVKQRVTKSVN
jgi:hypothetical protein